MLALTLHGLAALSSPTCDQVKNAHGAAECCNPANVNAQVSSLRLKTVLFRSPRIEGASQNVNALSTSRPPTLGKLLVDHHHFDRPNFFYVLHI